MENLFKNSNLVYYSISAIVAGLGLLSIIWKGLSLVFKNLQQKYNHLEEIHGKVEKIFSELTPNHGSSIKDKIDSLDGRMNKIDENLVKNNDLTEKIFYRQRWILDNQDAAVFESDIHGKCIWANVHYLRLIKRNMEFVLGNGWKNIIAQEDRDRVIKNWEMCVQNGINSEDTFTMVDSEGKTHKVFCSATKTDDSGYIGSLKILD